MRKIIENQFKFGQVDISGIELDLRYLDEIPQLLTGLQAVYPNREACNNVFAILEAFAPHSSLRIQHSSFPPSLPPFLQALLLYMYKFLAILTESVISFFSPTQSNYSHRYLTFFTRSS